MGNRCPKLASSDSSSAHLKVENVTARRESIMNESESSVAKTVTESMVHWSQVSEAACTFEGEVAEIDNREVFKQLQSHPQWGKFFATFGYSLGIFPSVGALEVGHKFAEGGQAELFIAHIQWANQEYNEEDLRDGYEWVLKVFKKGTLLRHLQSQWPIGFLKFMAEDFQREDSGMPPPTMLRSEVHLGVLLKDGRFAFLLRGHHEDLRNLINRKMLTKTGDSMLIDKGVAERMIYRIAKGMDWLHRHNIVHRDLKASNVLYKEDETGWSCYVADFECSVGVVGTRFWRAPEILQAIKDKNVRPEVFTKEADVYAYGMTCYEILTGKLPFKDHPSNDYDLILERKQRPKLPEYVEGWMQELVSRCWQEDPTARPSFREIMDVLATNSIDVRDYQRSLQQYEDDRQRWKERREKREE